MEKWYGDLHRGEYVLIDLSKEMRANEFQGQIASAKKQNKKQKTKQNKTKTKRKGKSKIATKTKQNILNKNNNKDWRIR